MIGPADGSGVGMRERTCASFGLTSHLINRCALLLRPAAGLGFIVALLASPVAAAAQAGGDGFLFRAPRVTLSLHGGFAQARAGSDLFEEITDFLTLNRNDFGGFTFGGDVGVRVTDQVDVVFGAMYGRSGARSEDRDYFDPGPAGEDSLPILQDTRLTRVPLTASLRFYLAQRGRTIGSFAWVPSTVAPYVGVGAGAMYHQFTQDGNFVDRKSVV